ncbi:MAG: hypothetical protein HQ591_02130 [candidate division Zixibacteria bacterium]|nr:hypothetical protein [Candidatus Tariuqbacter arcticus]
MSRPIKKIRKFLFALIIVYIILAISLSYFAGKVDEIIIEKVEEALGGDLSVQYFGFNLFTGFVMKEVTIIFPGDSLMQSVSEVRFSYSLPALFRKKINITGITIINPVFHIVMGMDGGWNVLPLNNLYRLEPIAVPEITTLSVPLEINLDKIIIKDINGDLITPQGRLTLKSGTIVANNIRFKSIDDFFAELQMKSLDGEFYSPQLPASVSFSINLNSEIDNNSAAYDLSALLCELSPDLDIPELSLSTKGEINLKNRSIDIDSIKLTLEKGRDFDFSGKGIVRELDENPRFELKFQLNSLNIPKDGWVNALLQRFLQNPPLLSFSLNKPTTLMCSGYYSISTNSIFINCSLKHSSSIKDLSMPSNGLVVKNIDIDYEADFTLTDSSFYVENSIFNVNGENIEFYQSPLPPLVINEIEASMGITDGIEGSVYINLSGFDETTIKCEALFSIPSNLMTIQPSPSYLNSITFAIDKLNPSNFGIDLLAGVLNLQFNMKNQNGLHFASMITVSDSLSLFNQDSSMVLPIDTITVEGFLNYNEDFTAIKLDEFKLNLSKWLTVCLTSELSDDIIIVDIAPARIDFIPLKRFSLPAQFIPVDFNPVLELSGGITAPISDLIKAAADFDLKLIIDTIDIESIKADNLSAGFKVEANDMCVDLSGEILLPSILISEYRSRPIQNFKVIMKSGIDIAAQNFNISSKVLLPSEGLVMELNGSGVLVNNKPKFNLNLTGNFNDSAWIEIIEDVKLIGGVSLNLTADYDSSLSISGALIFEDFGVMNPLMEIIDLSGRIPFDQTLELEPLVLYKREIYENPFYFKERPYLLGKAAKVNNFTVDRIRLSGYDMTGISADVYWEEGNFQIPYFAVSLFEGNLSGNLWLRVDSLADGSVSYSISALAAEINSDLVLKMKSKGDGASKVSFNFNFLGKQLDPTDPKFNIEGALHITQISPKVAENLLLTLDPQQQDKGIQSMLYFLEKGWGIRGFSFEVANDFVYSTIFTQQPPPKKVLPFLISRVLPLEKEIRLSRLPIKFFLKM